MMGQHVQESTAKELRKQFTELVQKHFRREHGAEFYAKELCVTTKYLTAALKEATGRTTSSLLSEALAIEAQGLLQQSNISVKEAANLLHFLDQSMFGKFFKREVGISPSEYKKRVRQSSLS